MLTKSIKLFSKLESYGSPSWSIQCDILLWVSTSTQQGEILGILGIGLLGEIEENQDREEEEGEYLVEEEDLDEKEHKWFLEESL